MRRDKILVVDTLPKISIHAPLTGCDVEDFMVKCILEDFNPRTPYGMRRLSEEYKKPILDISIHAPLTGCDPEEEITVKAENGFQSTHPLRDATYVVIDNEDDQEISIHAPLTGCDRSL